MPLMLGVMLTTSTMPQVGQVAPNLHAMSTSDKVITLSELKGSWVVLYFYPKAFTPGCTKEACSLRDGYFGIQKLGAVILGVSFDKIATLKKFKAEYHLPFELLSDSDKRIAKAYDVVGLLGLYAKRKTFIIDPDGKIAFVFDSVDSAHHNAEVTEKLKALVAAWQ